MTTDSTEMVINAFNEGKLKNLLLGEHGYRYMPKWSMAFGDTDVVGIMRILYKYAQQVGRLQVHKEVTKSLDLLVQEYEGIFPVASCILYEVGSKIRGRFILEIPLDDIAVKLKKSIYRYKERLREDKTEDGTGWPEGRLDDLRRLSKITEEYGGPAFCD